MDISQISAKQKRYREWREFLNNPSLPDQVRKELEVSLNKYGRLIVQIWDAGTATASDDIQLRDLERTLEMLNESVRLQGMQTLGREFNK